MGLSDFPSFSSEASLFRELRRQGFEIERRGPGYRITHPSRPDDQVFMHSGSITDRSGKRQSNAMKSLSALGFLPPAEFARQERQRKREVAMATKKPPKEPPAEPKAVPVPEPEPADPKRKYPCTECASHPDGSTATQRCHRCADAELPCAFPYPQNLGRHMAAVHSGRPIKQVERKSTRSRSGPVVKRTDTSVIKDPLRRLARQVAMQAFALVKTAEELAAAGEQMQAELNELRAFKREIEKTAGALYDVTTRPKG